MPGGSASLRPRGRVPSRRASDGYLDPLKVGSGRVIISATRGSDPAFVREGAKYGVFTGHFLDGLRGSARGDGGVIRILDLYSYVQEKVVADQPNQRPVLKVSSRRITRSPVSRWEAPRPRSHRAPADEFEYDVFLSYRRRSPTSPGSARRSYPRLKAEGLKVCIDAVLPARRARHPEIERAVTESRYTMGVMSRATSEQFLRLREYHRAAPRARTKSAPFLGSCASPAPQGWASAPSTTST